MDRIHRLEEKGKYSSGEWSKDEMKRLDEALEIYGAGNWKVINRILLTFRPYQNTYSLVLAYHVSDGIRMINSNRARSVKKRMSFF